VVLKLDKIIRDYNDNQSPEDESRADCRNVAQFNTEHCHKLLDSN